uniref:Secreted protein n=1 Tax=Parascaris univalens TaxID=6257 RepID=A0A915B3G3_PARUN
MFAIQLTLHGNEKRSRAGASWTATHLSSTGIASNTSTEAMPTSDALCEDNSPISHCFHAGNSASRQSKQRDQLSSAAVTRNAKSEQGYQVQRADQNEREQKVPCAFVDACISGNTESVRALIRKTPSLVSYAPVLCHGYSGLHYAAKGGHHDVVRVLLDNGADVNLRTAVSAFCGCWSSPVLLPLLVAILVLVYIVAYFRAATRRFIWPQFASKRK